MMEHSEFWLHEFDYQRAEMLHRLEVQNELGQGALKSMMLVNGGAIIALLTFLGNKQATFDHGAVQCAMWFYGSGLFFCLLAYFGAYFSQANFMQTAGYRVVNAQSRMANDVGTEVPEKYAADGMKCLYAAIASLFFSLVLFGGGSAFAIKGIL